MATVLSNRVLNRTLLHRQQLLGRAAVSTEQMCTHLVGLQAQEMRPPFIGLWSRIADFDPATVDAGLDDRRLVRITLMRGTIHLVTADDAVRIAPLIQPELEKAPFRKGFYYGATVGMDRDDVCARGATLIGDDPISTAELRAKVAEQWPDRDPGATARRCRTRRGTAPARAAPDRPTRRRRRRRAPDHARRRSGAPGRRAARRLRAIR